MSDALTHFDKKGQAVMVDVSDKNISQRKAVAAGLIKMNSAAYQAIESGTSKKGDVLSVARIAGIFATKKCSDLIPLCHPTAIEKVSIEFEMLPESLSVKAKCTVCCTGKTGVEMEALCGVNIALLTIYDMCKAIDRSMTISEINLLEKQGGKSGIYLRKEKT